MEYRVKRDNVAIVLVEPKLPENIGAVARAMNNMDIGRLILVNPMNVDEDRIARIGGLHRLADRGVAVGAHLQCLGGDIRWVGGTRQKSNSGRNHPDKSGV